MGATQVEINIHCPYCCKKQKCEGFQEIENLRDTGWVVYGHTEYENQDGEAGKSTSLPQTNFILCNRKNKKMAAADFLAHLDKKKIPCPRCRLKLEHAQRLINRRAFDETTDVVGVCDHCLLKMRTEESCYKCAKIVNKFLAAWGEQDNDINKYCKSWLTKIEYQLNEELPKVKPQKKFQRSYSDINISLPSRDISKTLIKSKVREMFHSEVNLLDTNREEKVRQPRSLVFGSEKAVKFTELIEVFHIVSSDSDIKNVDVEQDSIDVRNEYYDLKPHSSIEAKHIRGSIAKTLQKQDETEQMVERKEEKLEQYKTSKYKTENIDESGPEFIFPQDPQKADTKLKPYVSSSELIKDTQEKLGLKAEEEERKIKEERERKAEEEKMKRLAREERKLLEKAEKPHKEAAIKVKLNLEQDTQKVKKDSSWRGEKTTEQTRPISGQEKKDVEESSKQIEPQKRSDKVKPNGFDKEKEKSNKFVTKQTRPISGQEKKDVEEFLKQVEPQKRSDKVKTNRFDEEKEKSVKSMTKQTRPISGQEKKEVEESSKQVEPQKRSDKVKTDGFDKEKEKSNKSTTKQTRPISGQEKKDVEESSKQIEPQKRSDKVKTNGFDKEKEKSIKSITKQTRPISGQEKKDVEESLKQIEPQKRSDKVKTNGFDKEKEKSVKSMTKQTRPISGQEKKDVEESSKQVEPQERSDKVKTIEFDKEKSVKSMTKKTRPISGQEKKDVEESSKQVEPQKRSDKVKTDGFDKEKEKSIKSTTKQTRPISGQEKKDVEESSKQIEPQKRSDKVKTNGFDKEKEKSVKSMTKQTRPISGQEKKDVEESSKQVEPQERSDKVKTNGFDKEKSVKSMTKKTRPISGQEKKDVEESSKQLEPQKRSDKVKTNGFDKEKEKAIKSKTKQTRPISGQEKKDVEESSKQIEPQKRSDKVKTNRFDKEKEKSVKSMTKQTRTISGQEKKDVEESSKQVEPQERSDKVKTNGFDKEKEKSIKSKTEEQKEEKLHSSIVKQLVQSKKKYDSSKTKKTGESEVPTSDINQLGKEKNIESANEQDVVKAKQPEGKDMISELTRKRKRPSKSVTGLEKKGDDILLKERNKSPKGKSDKVKELKEDVKGLEKKRDALQPMEKDKSEIGNKLEDSKQKDIKMDKIKLIKASADDIILKLIKGNNKKIAMDTIQSKLPELSKLLLEATKTKDKLVEKLTSAQVAIKNQVAKKKEDDNVDSKQKDIKMDKIKLIKASADDIILKLIKGNNKKIAMDTIQSKLPELSKLLLEATKTKDKLVEKLTSAQVAIKNQVAKKKEDDNVDLPSKEKEVKELRISQVKLVENNMDNVILRLIQIRSDPVRTSDRGKMQSVMQSVKKKKRRRVGYNKTEPEVGEEESSEEFNIREEPTQERMDFGQGEQPFPPPQREGQEMKPLYVQFKLAEISSSTPLRPVEKARRATDDRKKDQFEMSKKKVVEPIDPDAGKGIIRYALSDRTFIEKGWTMLPVEKVVRKMNIYRMRPAQPEFDWFEHNKKKGIMLYDNGAKLAEFDNNGHGRWFYKNGRLALDYYEAEETNTQQRFVVYSNGELDERGRSHPITILATFDHLGNGVVFDHAGKIRLKYNQTEGVLLDRSVGPVTNWKWHSLNDPPVLQQVMIDTQMPLKDPKILKMGGPADNRTRPDNEEMLAIEFDNFIKEKSKKLTQTFKPFQIKMKALKINNHFSLKVLDQATIYLIFRDGSANLKLNIGMVLDHKEIVDTDTAELGEVSNSMERFPARTDSLAALQHSVAYARRYERMRTERERKLRRPEPCISADNLGKAASRPLRPPLRTVPTGSISPSEASSRYCKCRRKPSSSLYYNTQLL